MLKDYTRLVPDILRRAKTSPSLLINEPSHLHEEHVSTSVL